jgi:hypothetical protein
MDLEWKELALEISSVSGETTTKMARIFQEVFEHGEM